MWLNSDESLQPERYPIKKEKAQFSSAQTNQRLAREVMMVNLVKQWERKKTANDEV